MHNNRPNSNFSNSNNNLSNQPLICFIIHTNNSINHNSKISTSLVDVADASVGDEADTVAVAIIIVVVNKSIAGRTDCAVTMEGNAAILHKGTNMMPPWKTAWAVICIMSTHDGEG